ncbi:MAG: TonB-dependent receptor plug domain-containing protein [Prevotella sp.]
MSLVTHGLATLLLFCAVVCKTAAQISVSPDTLKSSLRGVTVSGRKVRTFLDSSGGTSIVNMEMMHEMPRILGNADPLRYAQTLPGVQTNSEYNAGLHIQGCDNAHNQVSIGGIPIYNAAHLLGFFSIFNSTHFHSMQLTKTGHGAAAPNRLGGIVDMRHSDSLCQATSGYLSVGPMSSQGTLRLPLGRNSSLTLSSRAAYLNLLYSQWLKFEDETMRYFFHDHNITHTLKLSERDMLRTDFYYGGDDVGYNDDTYSMKTKLKWSNTMASLHWQHSGDGGAETGQTIYYTGYRNRFNLNQPTTMVRLDSHIYDFGYKGSLKYGRSELGADLMWHNILPQTPYVDGVISHDNKEAEAQHALETSLYATTTLPLASRSALTLGLRYTFFGCGDSRRHSIDPSAALAFTLSPASTLTLSTGIKHQYLFKTGFSDVGLPTEFWLASGEGRKPQYSYNVSLLFDTYLQSKTWHISAETYYKRLLHQIEYIGNVYDFIFSDYELDNVLLYGSGYNYGLNLLVERRKGRLTGWVGYSFGRAWRRFPGTEYDGRYPASHERIHEVNAVATYRVGKHWSFGSSFVSATGTPYTGAKRFYLINQNVITEFGSHNGSRVPAYMRLDLSANYDFNCKKGRQSGINLSLYNATGHKNALLYRLKIREDKYGYRPFNFILKILPSVNYYYRF